MNLIPIKQIREANTEFLLGGSFGLDRYWHVMYANMPFLNGLRTYGQNNAINQFTII